MRSGSLDAEGPDEAASTAVRIALALPDIESRAPRGARGGDAEIGIVLEVPLFGAASRSIAPDLTALDERRERLIERIYEAATSPRCWRDVLGHLAALCNATGAVLFTTQRQQPSHGLATREVDASRWRERSRSEGRLLDRLRRAQQRGFVLFEDGDCESFDDGGRVTAAAFIEVDAGEGVVFAVETPVGGPPLQLGDLCVLNGVWRHLARASRAAWESGEIRSAAAIEALTGLGLPAAALTASGGLVCANAPFQALAPVLLVDRAERVALVDKAADQRFVAALASPGRAHAIPLPPIGAQPAHVLEVRPLARQEDDVFGRADLLCTLASTRPKDLPPAELLQALFDLTSAEARVARSIGQGETLDEIATAVGVSRETVRAQLKAVFAKTGVTRQAELVRLVGAATIVSR